MRLACLLAFRLTLGESLDRFLGEFPPARRAYPTQWMEEPQSRWPSVPTNARSVAPARSAPSMTAWRTASTFAPAVTAIASSTSDCFTPIRMSPSISFNMLRTNYNNINWSRQLSHT